MSVTHNTQGYCTFHLRHVMISHKSLNAHGRIIQVRNITDKVTYGIAIYHRSCFRHTGISQKSGTYLWHTGISQKLRTTHRDITVSDITEVITPQGYITKDRDITGVTYETQGYQRSHARYTGISQSVISQKSLRLTEVSDITEVTSDTQAYHKSQWYYRSHYATERTHRS